MSDIKYDPSGYSNLSFDVTAEIYSCYMTFFSCFSIYSKYQDLIEQ